MTDLQHQSNTAYPSAAQQSTAGHGNRSADVRPLSVSARLGRLQFHNSGKFRVLQFADIQDGPKVSGDTIKLIEAALDAARPDIVIFTGNQIAGYDQAYAATFRKRRWAAKSKSSANSTPQAAERAAIERDRTRETVRGTIAKFLQPLIDRGIPWAVTYGNHDFQCGLDNAEMDAIYREFPGCLNPESTAAQMGMPRTMPASGLPDQQVYPCEPGTLALPVMDAERRRIVLGLALLDSGDYARFGGYGSPSARGMRFLEMLPDVMGEGAQTLVFQHLPLPQYYDLLKEVPATAARAIEGYREFAGRHFVLNDELIQPGSYLGEGISCPDADSGEFAMLRDGAFFGVVAAHDHRNAFVGTLDGVMLAASPTCGFGSYGPVPEKRAARLFEFDIRHPFSPRTQLLEYGDLIGKPSSRKAYAYGMTSESRPESEGMDLLHKPNWWRRLLAMLR